jgi:hypothetical protein
MNSHQRRKVNRAWKYQVTLGYCEWDNYNNYCNARNWCNANFGKTGYTRTNRYSFRTFYFKKPKAAAAFALRWS